MSILWSELDDMMESIPRAVVAGGNFNGHVGEGNRGDEEGIVEYYGVKSRNVEKQMVVGFEKRISMVVVNVHFKKRELHRVT